MNPLTPEQKANFNRYEVLKGTIKEAEDELKKLQPLIIPLVPEDKELLTPNGYFYIQKRSSYKYSEALEAEEEKLEQHKADEKAKGIAEVTFKNTLYYKTGRPEPREE